MKRIQNLLCRLDVLLAVALIVALVGSITRSATGPGSPRRTVYEAPLTPLGPPQFVTDLSSVTHLTVPAGAYMAWIETETADVRWRDDYVEGTLSTRTDGDTGVCTLSSGHLITVSDTVSVWWSGGDRKGMTVTAVNGSLVTVDAGTGDNLPATSSAVDVGPDPTATVGFLIYAGDKLPNYNGDLTRFRALQATAGAKMNINFYKP